MAPETSIRNSVKAVIIQGGRLLCTRNRDELGDFYLLPGGGQEKFESLHTALARECLEEIGAMIEIGELALVREYVARNHEFAASEPEVHQIELMFACRLAPGAVVMNGSSPDTKQTGIEWLELGRLAEYRIYPDILKRVIGADGIIAGRIYLGDVN